MELPKTFKGKLTPRARNIILHKSFEQSRKNNREFLLPKDIVLSILNDNQTFAISIIKSFNPDIKQLSADISEEKSGYQKPPNNKVYHESFFRLMKIAEKVSHEMKKNQIGTDHIILAFLRYSGQSKHILNIKNILNKYKIKYEKYYEGVVSIQNIVEENSSIIKSNKIKKIKKVKKVNKEEIENKEEVLEKKSQSREQNMESRLISMGMLKNLNEYVLSKDERAIGFEDAIQKCIQILCRKKKSNPIIIGEPGVGKTCLAEAIAKAIVEQKVPKKIRNSTIYEISLGSVVAGTKFRGQFEEKMMNLLDFFSKNNSDLSKIAFIDEIHHIIKAGSSEGAIDASFMLKPKLAEGTFKCIGATTYEEYRKFVMSDKALARRFRPVFLDEPDVNQTIEILKQVKNEYEKFHNLFISDECIKKCVELSDNYIKDRFFPDKAFDILDEACSQIVSLYTDEKNEESLELNVKTIEEVISNITGIPITNLSGTEKEKLSSLEDKISSEIISQKSAISSVCNSIKRSRLGFKDKNKPIGCFLFVGRTGVGKTLLSKKLSEHLFGEGKLIRLDMSEYMEKHTVSKISGAPPGYVGYENGGQLAEMVKNKPYSVILLDEIEKAHPDVINIFLQILDDGRLTDSFGRVIDFRHTIIIMTSNLSASKLDQISKLGFNKSSINKTHDEIEEFLKSEAKKHFPPEFINRLDDIIIFKSFTKQDIERIFDLEMKKSLYRLAENGYVLEVTESLRSHIMESGYDEKYGARPMSRAISRLLESPLANAYFSGLITSDETIVADYKDGEIVFSNS